MFPWAPQFLTEINTNVAPDVPSCGKVPPEPRGRWERRRPVGCRCWALHAPGWQIARTRRALKTLRASGRRRDTWDPSRGRDQR